MFVYLIAEHKGMTERACAVKQQKRGQGGIRQVCAVGCHAEIDPTEQIAKAKQMLDAGTINQAEFEQIKRKALATA